MKYLALAKWISNQVFWINIQAILIMILCVLGIYHIIFREKNPDHGLKFVPNGAYFRSLFGAKFCGVCLQKDYQRNQLKLNYDGTYQCLVCKSIYKKQK